ncbi:hypothetical protein QP176_00385 [Sphingomonas aerolata]
MRDMFPAKVEDVEQDVERGRTRPGGATLDLRQCLPRDADAPGDLRLRAERLAVEPALAATLQKGAKIATQPTRPFG